MNLNKLLISCCAVSSLYSKQPDFLIHNHPHINAEQLVQSKEKSTMTYNQIMKQFGKAYIMIQDGVITQNISTIKSGINIIQNHPSPKNNPWDIVKTKDIQSFKETLLYYDEQLHKSILNIENSLKKDDWIDINNNIFKLSNQCINCHIIWKDNLKLN